MADSSFDIVSEVDKQEADNALNQSAKEVAQRFDFKNTGTTIEWKGDLVVEITSSTEERASAALDVLKDKIVKRGISLKAFDHGEPRSSGKEYKINGTFTSGISSEQAKKLSKLIRDDGPKGVKTQIQGDELRVTHFAYDLTAARQDPNAVLPLRALNHLVAEQRIECLATNALTFMGGIYSSRKVKDVLAPAIVAELKEEEVDLAILIPV